tara:strand:- start:445 stop:579 length:135 start_codon:yes stop_codon:yes gene_type:complete
LTTQLENPLGTAYAIFLYIVHRFFRLFLTGFLATGLSKRLSDKI